MGQIGYNIKTLKKCLGDANVFKEEKKT